MENFSFVSTNTLGQKHFLVTGASQGLGAVIAKWLAQVGVKVTLLSRNQENLIKVRQTLDNPSHHSIQPCDLARPEEIAQSISVILKNSPPLDGVIHTAGGGFGFRSPLLSHEQFSHLFQVNLGSVVAINTLVVPSMIERGWGRLIHIGSIASSEAVASVGYNTVKAGLAAYVRSLGRELAGKNVVATGILPGGFLAPSNAMARLQENKPDVYQKFIDDRLPRGFMGQAEEILPLIIFLCSDASSMMGGCMVPIDAGEGISYLPS